MAAPTHEYKQQSKGDIPLFNNLPTNTGVVFFCPSRNGSGTYVFGKVVDTIHGKMCQIYEGKIISSSSPNCLNTTTVKQADWTKPYGGKKRYWVSDFLANPRGYEMLKKYPQDDSYNFRFVGVYDESAHYTERYVDGY